MSTPRKLTYSQWLRVLSNRSIAQMANGTYKQRKPRAKVKPAKKKTEIAWAVMVRDNCHGGDEVIAEVYRTKADALADRNQWAHDARVQKVTRAGSGQPIPSLSEHPSIIGWKRT